MQGTSHLAISTTSGGEAFISANGNLVSRYDNGSSALIQSEGALFATPAVIPSGVASLQAVTSIAAEVNYAISRQFLQPLYSYSDDAYVPALPDTGIVFLVPLSSWGYAEGASGQGEAYLQALGTIGGDYNYSVGFAELQPLNSFGVYLSNFVAPMYHQVKLSHSAALSVNTVIVVFESPNLTHSSSAGRFAYDELLSFGAIDSLTTNTVSKIVSIYSTGEVTEFYASDRIAQEQFIQDAVALGDPNPVTIFNVTIDNPLQVDGAIDALMSLLQALEEPAIVEGTVTTLHDRLVEFFSYPSINDTSLPVKQTGGSWEIPGVSDSRTWVVNLDTSTSSQYDGYGYNSFFERDGKYYGVADDGIYLLEGETDAGKEIAALIETGKSSLGSSYKKRILNVYAGVSSSGKVLLKVEADGIEYVYEARSYSANLITHRFDIGRGLAGNYFNLTLLNQDGNDFDLENISFNPLVLERKI